MPTDQWITTIHQRLLSGDPTASAELAENVFEPLKEKLAGNNSEIDDPNLISDACGDAMLNYIKNPGSFDPSKRGLMGYLLMSAQGDLVNTLDSLARKKKGKTIVNLVEPDEIPRNLLSELAENTERAEVGRQIAEIFPDERDQQAALMMIDGEKATERFAAVFEIEDASIEEQKSFVKKNKDRIKRAMQRKLGRTDE